MTDVCPGSRYDQSNNFMYCDDDECLDNVDNVSGDCDQEDLDATGCPVGYKKLEHREVDRAGENCSDTFPSYDTWDERHVLVCEKDINDSHWNPTTLDDQEDCCLQSQSTTACGDYNSGCPKCTVILGGLCNDLDDDISCNTTCAPENYQDTNFKNQGCENGYKHLCSAIPYTAMVQDSKHTNVEFTPTYALSYIEGNAHIVKNACLNDPDCKGFTFIIVLHQNITTNLISFTYHGILFYDSGTIVNTPPATTGGTTVTTTFYLTWTKPTNRVDTIFENSKCVEMCSNNDTDFRNWCHDQKTEYCTFGDNILEDRCRIDWCQSSLAAKDNHNIGDDRKCENHLKEWCVDHQDLEMCQCFLPDETYEEISQKYKDAGLGFIRVEPACNHQ